MAVTPLVTTPKPGVAQQTANVMNSGHMTGARLVNAGAPGTAGKVAANANAPAAPTTRPAGMTNAQWLATFNPAQAKAFSAWVTGLQAQHAAAGGPAPGVGGSPAPSGPGTPGAPGSAPAGGPAGPAGAGPSGGYNLPGPQQAEFNNAQNTINENANSQLNQNTYAQNQARINFDAQQKSNTALQLQERQNEAGQFVSRGILGSGIQGRDIVNMTTMQAARANGIQNARVNAMKQFYFQSQQIENARAQALANLRLKYSQTVDAGAEKNVTS